MELYIYNEGLYNYWYLYIVFKEMVNGYFFFYFFLLTISKKTILMQACDSNSFSFWWAFRPRKRIFSPHPPPPKIPHRHPPSPSAPPPPSWETPLPPGRPPSLLGFSIKNGPPPPSWCFGLPLPLPRAEKIKNIRNVHQALDFSHYNSNSQRFFL